MRIFTLLLAFFWALEGRSKISYPEIKIGDEISFSIKNINAIKTSSKASYKEKFFFVGELLEWDKKTNSNEPKNSIIFSKGNKIEFMLNKRSCYDLVKLVFKASDVRLEVKNAKVEFIKPTPNKLEYLGFVKIGASGRNGAEIIGCSIKKL